MPSKIIEIGAKGYISASQIANLYGCGFGTPLDVYNRLIGKEEPKEFSEEAQKSMEFGSFFEDAVAQFFMKKTGLKVKKVGDGKRAYWSKDMPYLICHPDRIGIGPDHKGRRFALEVKCVRPSSDGWGEEWTDEVPDYYYLQDETYFVCEVPCDVVYMAVLKGNRVYFYEALPDFDVVADIKRRAKEFKENTDKGIEPEPVNYDEAFKVYGRKVNMVLDGVGANDEVLKVYQQLLDCHKAMEGAKTEEESAKMKLMELLGEAPAFVTTDGSKIKRICYWSDMKRSTLDADKLKAEHPEINYSDYMKTTETKSFRVTYPRGEKENG